MNQPNPSVIDSSRRSLYKIGGTAALLAVAVGVSEVAITFFPGGSTSPQSVIDWYALFHNNWFLGLRDLGLLNMFLTALGVVVALALYTAHERVDKMRAALALIVAILGAAVFYSTNRAFAMYDLSNQFAAASTDTQKAMLEAAGQAMLAVGRSHSPGTFLAFFFNETCFILMSWVTLRGGVFSKTSAIAGLLGFGFLLLFEIVVSFVPAAAGSASLLALPGGLLSLLWYVLVARRLFQLGSNNSGTQD